MIPRTPKKQSALDLTIKGSMGDFVVSQGDVSSVRVHYLLSHIGLEMEGDHQERLLSPGLRDPSASALVSRRRYRQLDAGIGQELPRL